jgi:hypothetical protein
MNNRRGDVLVRQAFADEPYDVESAGVKEAQAVAGRQIV